MSFYFLFFWFKPNISLFKFGNFFCSLTQVSNTFRVASKWLVAPGYLTLLEFLLVSASLDVFIRKSCEERCKHGLDRDLLTPLPIFDLSFLTLLRRLWFAVVGTSPAPFKLVFMHLKFFWFPSLQTQQREIVQSLWLFKAFCFSHFFLFIETFPAFQKNEWSYLYLSFAQTNLLVWSLNSLQYINTQVSTLFSWKESPL